MKLAPDLLGVVPFPDGTTFKEITPDPAYVEGPFRRIGTILAQDGRVARGAGHHSIVNVPGTDEWYIAYHRRPLGETDGNHRELAVERLYFNDDGTIRPVVMTNEGVAPRLVR